jgi:hypothetical protein
MSPVSGFKVGAPKNSTTGLAIARRCSHHLASFLPTSSFTLTTKNQTLTILSLYKRASEYAVEQFKRGEI